MTHTMAAVFDNRVDADLAREALIRAGFGGETIHLSDASNTAVPVASQQTGAAGESTEDETSFGASVRHFFGKLLGVTHRDRQFYAEAIQHGHIVLTVETPTHDEAERAAHFVEAFRPLDLDEQRTRWSIGDWLGAERMQGGAGMVPAGVGSQQSAQPSRADQPSAQSGSRQSEQGARSDQSRSSQGASAQGSMQRGETGEQSTPGGNVQYGPGQGTTLRGSTRIYPSDSSTQAPGRESFTVQRGGTIGPTDEGYFIAHWQEHFSDKGETYLDYEPAYRYGWLMASNSVYMGQPWDAAETELRIAWEDSHPESSWEKFKGAIREGWNRMTK